MCYKQERILQYLILRSEWNSFTSTTVAWRAEQTERRPRASNAVVIQRVKVQQLHFNKML